LHRKILPGGLEIFFAKQAQQSGAALPREAADQKFVAQTSRQGDSSTAVSVPRNKNRNLKMLPPAIKAGTGQIQV